MTGPILVGVLISVTGTGIFRQTQGFQAMWIVCAGAALLSLHFVYRLRAVEDDRRQLRPPAGP